MSLNVSPVFPRCAVRLPGARPDAGDVRRRQAALGAARGPAGPAAGRAARGPALLGGREARRGELQRPERSVKKGLETRRQKP